MVVCTMPMSYLFLLSSRLLAFLACGSSGTGTSTSGARGRCCTLRFLLGSSSGGRSGCSSRYPAVLLSRFALSLVHAFAGFRLPGRLLLRLRILLLVRHLLLTVRIAGTFAVTIFRTFPVGRSISRG